MEQVIKVELTFDEAPEFNREIKISIDFQTKNGRGYGVGGGQWCDHCDNKFEEYEYNASAYQIRKGKFRISFTYIYPRKWKGCNFEKIFIVEKNKPSEMQVRCGARLKAYYAKTKKEE